MDLNKFVNLLYHISPRQLVSQGLTCIVIQGNWGRVRGIWREKKPFLPATYIINNGREQETSIFCAESNPQELSPYFPLLYPTLNFILTQCSSIKKQNSS